MKRINIQGSLQALFLVAFLLSLELFFLLLVLSCVVATLDEFLISVKGYHFHNTFTNPLFSLNLKLLSSTSLMRFSFNLSRVLYECLDEIIHM